MNKLLTGNNRWDLLDLLELLVLLFANAMMAVSTIYSACNSSPLFDEPAHFMSGVILAETADAGYFKVNPPLNKWITALASPMGTLAGAKITLPLIVPSSSFSNTSRPEFTLGDSAMALNMDRFLAALQWARLVRIPFLVLASWLIWLACTRLSSSKRVLAVSLWCFSPLILGHGWVVSADALTGVVMCAILVATQQVWKRPNWESFAMSGVCWGLAIGTKFTFAPLYLAYPIATELCMQRSFPSWRSRIGTMGRQWLLHALVASVTLCSLYLFADVGTPLKKHDFVSNLFSPLRADRTDHSALLGQVMRFFGGCPSPFPRSFLEGIDQQLADMDNPRGAYLLGTRLSGKLPWFFVAGYMMKEQLAVWLAIGMIAVAICIRFVRRSSPSTEMVRETIFCSLFLACFGFLMATQSNLVWNVRYLIPGLPLVYVLIAIHLPSLPVPAIGLLVRRGSLATEGRSKIDLAVPMLGLVMLSEFLLVAPFHFSYLNPMFGGTYRSPPGLNDSNFDYGQDLFYAKGWIERNRPDIESRGGRVYGLLSGHGRKWMVADFIPASRSIVERALITKLESEPSGLETRGESILIISRGLVHPEPWAVRYSTVADATGGADVSKAIAELLRNKPDFFISPAMAGYYLDAP